MNKFIPYVMAVVLFLIVAISYMSPVLEGKQLAAQDSEMSKGMAKEIRDFREETGEEALWTNGAFGGMPAYLISTVYKGDLPAKFQKWMTSLPRPVSLVFYNFLFFFVLSLIFGANVWVGFAGALAYGFFSFFFVIIHVGHFTKAHTLTYVALLVAGVVLAYRSKPVAGSLLASLGLSWMLSANHPQITYYAGILVILIGLSYLAEAVRSKTMVAFIKASGLLLAAVLLAVGTNFGRLYTTWEYGKFSTRGKSELTTDEKNQTGGLDKSYILDYSYDTGEAMTAFIARFKGGGMNEPLGEDSETYKFIKNVQGADVAGKFVSGLPLYWGSQPISAAPFYYGAVLCFLFVLGLFLVRGPDKWWIAAVVVSSFLLSLGKHFPALSDFMISYFPGYNKFRDVKNIIVIQQFAMAVMGVLAVNVLWKGELSKELVLKKLKYAWIITGGLALAFVIMPGIAGNFSAASDAQYMQNGWPAELIEALRADRRMVLRNDAFKSLVFVSLAAGVIWLYLNKKLRGSYAVLLWGLLIVADMWPVNKKYLNNDQFESPSKVEKPFQASKADQVILADKDPDFRVLNLTVSVFNDGSTSWFHHSLGGYHGAKMERYQEMIDHHIFPEIRQLIAGFRSPEAVDSVLRSSTVINMLNTKYIIFDRNSAPLENFHAWGDAWFADDVQVVENANEEIKAAGELEGPGTAVVDQRFADGLKDLRPGGAGESSVELVEYKPNKLKYKARVGSGKPLAVFSQIWYPKGWRAYIDGEETPIVRANYLLRGLLISEGEHEVEFRFEPASYYTGNKVALGSSLMLILALAGVGYIEYKKRKTGAEKETAGKN